jgi:hypothetical protein
MLLSAGTRQSSRKLTVVQDAVGEAYLSDWLAGISYLERPTQIVRDRLRLAAEQALQVVERFSQSVPADLSKKGMSAPRA